MGIMSRRRNGPGRPRSPRLIQAASAVGVASVAEAVADEAEGEHRHHHEQAGDQEPGGVREVSPSLSSAPQLTAGGRMPSPRKLSEVSPRIIHGMRSVRCTTR